MKVLQINTNDLNGGAARAAYRIHQGLKVQGVDSHFFVQVKARGDTDVLVSEGKINKLKTMVNQQVTSVYKKISGNISSLPWDAGKRIFNTIGNITLSDYDICNLHWINSGFIGIEDLRSIRIPIVWTLHDSWAFTGGCHIPYDCIKYETKCSQCEQLYGRHLCDLAASVFEKKKKNYSSSMTIITPSHWLQVKAEHSLLLRNCKICHIPNGIDTSLYRPRDRNYSRSILGIDQDTQVILFGAMGAATDPNKGVDYFQKAMRLLRECLPNPEKVQILIFGSSQPYCPPEFGFLTRYLGRLYDDISLNVLYSAADVMVVPSKSENFPNVILEAMACGTPCVAFDVGGISEIIDSEINGCVASPYISEDLMRKIKYVLSDSVRKEKLSIHARNKVVTSYDIRRIARQYERLYDDVLRDFSMKSF